MKKASFSAAVFLLLIFAVVFNAYAKTVFLEGLLESRIRVVQRMGFEVGKPVSKLTFRFALPAGFSNRAVSQEIAALDVGFTPRPSRVEDETDRFGNGYRVVIWTDLRENASVSIKFDAHIRSELSAMSSRAIYPLKNVPAEEAVFLFPTEQVQSDSPQIVSLSGRLTSQARTEYEAVTSILNYVSDNIRYAYNPPRYDALYTIGSGTGNCQNFAHVSMALLRAAGIPARIVGGISLKEPWKIPVENNAQLVQSMGQGGHAWMEIYFSDLGWLSYDPQQSKQFTSSRHIKQTHGLDSRDINDSWKGSPYLPAYSEMLDANFLSDTVSLRPGSSEKAPRSYLFSNNLVAEAPRVQTPPQPEKPPVQKDEKKPGPETAKPPSEPKGVKPKPGRGKPVEFGNTVFPELVDLYNVVGDTGVKILDKETAEYVTSRYVFAQAFVVEDPIALGAISLAMHKFGGDGSLYVDVVSDENGKPSLNGIRSRPVFLDSMSRKQGYYWVDFSFPDDKSSVLRKGKYWIILRHSGEAIVNWFYIPGKPYGGSDDTRSTLKGYTWDDIQNYDFVFRVRGKRV